MKRLVLAYVKLDQLSIYVWLDLKTDRWLCISSNAEDAVSQLDFVKKQLRHMDRKLKKLNIEPSNDVF